MTRIALIKSLSLGQMVINGFAFSSDDNMRLLESPLLISNIFMASLYFLAICYRCRPYSQRPSIVNQQHMGTTYKLLIFSWVSLIAQYYSNSKSDASDTSLSSVISFFAGLSSVIPFFTGALGSVILYELMQIVCCCGAEDPALREPLVPELPDHDSDTTAAIAYAVIDVREDTDFDDNSPEATSVATVDEPLPVARVV